MDTGGHSQTHVGSRAHTHVNLTWLAFTTSAFNRETSQKQQRTRNADDFTEIPEPHSPMEIYDPPTTAHTFFRLSTDWYPVQKKGDNSVLQIVLTVALVMQESASLHVTWPHASERPITKQEEFFLFAQGFVGHGASPHGKAVSERLHQMRVSSSSILWCG